MATISMCRLRRLLKRSTVYKHLTSSLVEKNQGKHASTFTYVAETPQTDGMYSTYTSHIINSYCTVL